MKRTAKTYYESLARVTEGIIAADGKGIETPFFQAVELACRLIQNQTALGRKLIFIGNGASAAISSHMATDFWKNGGMRAVAFNDSSLLTCIGNDYGYAQVFEKPVEMFADKEDIMLAISSSGKSENILNGVKMAREKGCKAITFSGFGNDNPLFQLGDINFYVPSQEYGPVEVIHQSIVHCMLDVILQEKSETS